MPNPTSHLPGYAVEAFTQLASGEPGFKAGQGGCRIHMLNHVTGCAKDYDRAGREGLPRGSSCQSEAPKQYLVRNPAFQLLPLDTLYPLPSPHWSPWGVGHWSFCSHPKSSTQAVPWLRCGFEAQFACHLHITQRMSEGTNISFSGGGLLGPPALLQTAKMPAG